MFSTIIELISTALDFISNNHQIKVDQRDRISNTLIEISHVLENTAHKLKDDLYPHQNCVVLENLAHHLHFYMMDFIPQEQLDELHRSLLEASQLEKLHAVRKQPGTIQKLEEASAKFKVLGVFWKI